MDVSRQPARNTYLPVHEPLYFPWSDQSRGGGEMTDSDEFPIHRRSNMVLRTLIDEMLERVRELNRNTAVWTSTERSRAEAELEAIMARVRRVAAQNSPTA
jgi:hypothetical protein